MALVSYGVQFMKKDSASLAYIGQKPGTQVPDSDAWFTPGEFIERVRRCMGSIDLDPFSCAEANVTIRARVFFSKEDSAIGRPWCTHGKVTVFINPPYGREIKKWIKKAYEEGLKPNTTVVCLIPSRTDTSWWWDYVTKGEIIFVRGRIKFINKTLPSYKEGEDNRSPAPFPSAIVIFGRKKSDTFKYPEDD